MLRALLAPLCALGLAAAPRAQVSRPPASVEQIAWHSQAAVNDGRSHGTIGDRLLSLAEAILLTNRELDENALSAEEVAQLSGFGGDIAWAGIDAGVVPVIVLERDLPVIRDTPHGFTITGSNGTPTIDLRDTRGIVVRSDFFDAANLRLLGGEHGIHLAQDDTLFGTLLDRVAFEGQDVAGLRLTCATPGGNTRAQIAGCDFLGLRTAILVDDRADGRSGRIELFADTTIRACDVGVELNLGTSGSMSVYLNGVEIRGGGDAFRLRGLGSPRRDLVFEGRHLRFSGARSALTIDLDPVARSVVLIQAAELASPATALRIGPFGGRADIRLQDSRLSGDIHLSAGSSGRVAAENLIVSGGAVDLGSGGAPVTVGASILDAASVLSSGSAPVLIRGSALFGGSVAATPSAPVTLEDGFHSGTSLGPHVTVLRPRSEPHLARFDASPPRPAPGSVLTLAIEIPVHHDGLVVFGRTAEFPATLPAGARLYADGSSLALLPGLLGGASQLAVPIPNQPALSGVDLFFHLVVAPRAGGAGFTLPPGRRVRVL